MSAVLPLPALSREEAKQNIKLLADQVRDSIAGEAQGQRWLHDAIRTSQPTQEVMFVADESMYSIRLVGTHHLATHVESVNFDSTTPRHAAVASAAYASRFLESASRAFKKHAAATGCAPVAAARIERDDLEMNGAPGGEQDQGASGQRPTVDDVAGAVRTPIEIAEVIS